MVSVDAAYKIGDLVDWVLIGWNFTDKNFEYEGEKGQDQISPAL